MARGTTTSKLIDELSSKVHDSFESDDRVLSYQEFLERYLNQPYAFSRNAAAYLMDMFDHWGTREVETPMGQQKRFKVFDVPFENGHAVPLVGQEEAQQTIYKILRSFLREGQINKLILLHGPNGSSKSSMFRCVIAGLEKYSHLAEGCFYSFNWVFPIETVYKKSIGLGGKEGAFESIDSYAHLDMEKISTIIPNEMRDNPLAILPPAQRKEFLKQCDAVPMDERSRELFHLLKPGLIRAELSAKSKQIYEALLTAYKGDLRKVLMHVQIERVYFSKRFQTCIATVDPQMNVDAVARQVTMNRSLSYIPPALQSLNLFELDGDLVHANRGMIEFNDLLKRPVEAFKYLLGTCETGIVNVGAGLAYLDEVMVGTCNEVQLDAFREYPDFASFQARMEFVRIPYLLRYSQEKEIYSQVLPGYAGSKHVNPYTTEIVALWAVLTRLRKPHLSDESPILKKVVEGLSCYEKAKLYDHGEIPTRLSAEEVKELRVNIKHLWNEFLTSPGYEGRFGASAREMKSLLYNASQTDDSPCVSAGSVLGQLGKFVTRVNEYEFLRMEPSGGFHAHSDFVEVVRDHFLGITDREFKEAMGLAEESQYPQMMSKYSTHVSAMLRNEKVLNEVTNQSEPPDVSMMTKVEEMLGIKKDREIFRRDIITQIAAWAHDHSGEKLDFSEIFPDYISRIKAFYHEEQRKVVVRHLKALLDLDAPNKELEAKFMAQAKQTLSLMREKYGYCDYCAKESASMLLKYKYS